MRDINDTTITIDELGERLATELNMLAETPPSSKELQEKMLEGKIAADGEPIFKYSSYQNIKVQSCGCGYAKDNVLQVEGPCTEPCNRFVPFCCLTEIPQGLRRVDTADFRAVYDPSALRCCVEECTADVVTPPNCPPVSVTVFAVRIIGCIPVSFSTLAFASRCGREFVTESDDNRVALCCSDTLCVNNVICYRGTREQAEAACEAIRAAIAANPCTAVIISDIFAADLFVFFGECTGRKFVLGVTGNLLLPECPAL